MKAASVSCYALKFIRLHRRELCRARSVGQMSGGATQFQQQDCMPAHHLPFSRCLSHILHRRYSTESSLKDCRGLIYTNHGDPSQVVKYERCKIRFVKKYLTTKPPPFGRFVHTVLEEITCYVKLWNPPRLCLDWSHWNCPLSALKVWWWKCWQRPSIPPT